MLCLILAAMIAAETSKPNSSMYALGEKVEVEFKASDLAKGSRHVLKIEVADEHEKLVASWTEEVRAGEGGEWRKVCPMPSERMGFFRVRAGIGGAKLPKRGSRPEGCLTYAVMPDPAKRVAPLEEDAFMGQMGENAGDAKIARWIGSRMFFGADIPCATKEAADRKMENYRQELAKTGYVTYGGSTAAYHDLLQLRPFYTEEGKKWLKAHPFKRIWDIFAIEDGERHFRDAVAAFTKAAREQLPPGRKRLLLEFFSEPDLLSPNPELIVRGAKAVWEAVRSVDTEALVAQPGLSTLGAQSYHQRLFELGIGKYMNAFHIHPYTAYPPEPNDYLENVRNIKRMVKEATGDPNTPLFALEAGYPTVATQKGELLQMNGQIRCLLMLLGEGFVYNYVFYSSDYGDDSAGNVNGDYGVTYNLKLKEKRFGTDCVSPRPVLPALAAFSWLMDGFRPVSCIDYLGETALGYAYRNRKGVCNLALWDFAGKRTVEIPVGRGKVRVADVFANERICDTDGGILTLELGPSPVYVLDVDSAVWGGGKSAVDIGGSSMRVVAGGKLEVVADVDGSGTLEVRPAAALGLKNEVIDAAKGRCKVSFDVPETVQGGEYPMMVALRDSRGRMKAVSGYRVKIDPPVSVDSVQPVFSGGAPGVAVTVRNLTGQSREVVLESRIRGVPEARRKLTVAVPAGASVRKELIFSGWEPNPFELHSTEVAVSSKGVYTLRTRELNYLCASRVSGNGDFRSWKPKMHPAPVNILANANRYTGPEDVSVKLACGWNDKYLLFAFDVEDDHFVQERRGWLTWWGDSVQLALAKDILEKSTANQVTDMVSQAVTETTFALTSAGPEVYRCKTFDDKRLPAGSQNGGDKGQIPLDECPLRVERTQTDKGVVVRYRMAIPWRYLAIDAPEPGRSVYFAASANDVDPDAAACVMFGVFQLKQSAPKRFGRIVLAP